MMVCFIPLTLALWGFTSYMMASNLLRSVHVPFKTKATAVWLIDNTALTFEQVGEFCGMHPMEVQGIADGEVAVGIVGEDPVASGQVSAENLRQCEEDANARLQLLEEAAKHISSGKAKSRYTPVARRQDKPDAIAWLLKYHPEITDAAIIKLIGTTRNTIHAVRDRTHWNSSNIRPKDPVLLGLCTQTQLNDVVARIKVGVPDPAIKDAAAAVAAESPEEKQA